MKKVGRIKGVKPTFVDGIRFDSKREAKRWCELQLLEKAGQISNLERQVKMPLYGRDGPILTEKGNQMHYVVDFTYIDWTLKGVRVFEDAKGHKTESYLMKKAILRASGIEITES